MILSVDYKTTKLISIINIRRIYRSLDSCVLNDVGRSKFDCFDQVRNREE